MKLAKSIQDAAASEWTLSRPGLTAESPLPAPMAPDSAGWSFETP